MIRLLAIGDLFIPAEYMTAGFKPLADLGVEVTVRQWEHPTLADLQRDNLAIEQGGCEAVQLPESVVHDVERFDIISMQFPPIGRAVVDRAKNLKVIGVLRGGTENVAVDHATGKGVCVLNTPGRNARAVAEFTFGMILAETRNIARTHAAMKQGVWRKSFPNSDYIPEMFGKTVGLVGYGYIGMLVAGYCKAFGCDVIAYDPYFKGDASPARLVDLDTLLKASDVISIHARLTEESTHMIGRAEFAKMKPNAVLVNTARSGLVDEKAMVEALQSGRIKGAAIDVFDTEPLPKEHPLVQLDNTLLTPHLAGTTKDAFFGSPRLMCGHLMNLIKGTGKLPIINGVPAPRLA